MESKYYYPPRGDLYRNLENNLLIYLQLDDNKKKLDKLRELEDCIENFLCLVPNDQKYIYKETAQILQLSALQLEDFSGYKASTGWKAIQLYAANLFAQPWRKEYKNLKTYCGYYKYEIEANLIGAHVMFELMGYADNGQGILSLDGPIDPEKVKNVCRDAIVANVECKILKKIWESTSNKLNTNWVDILKYREYTPGTPEKAIEDLNYHHALKLRISEKQDNYSNAHKIPSTYILSAMNPLYASLPKYAHVDTHSINGINGVYQNRHYFPNESYNAGVCQNFSNIKLFEAVPSNSVTRRYLPNTPVNTGSIINYLPSENEETRNAKCKIPLKYTSDRLLKGQETFIIDETDNTFEITNKMTHDVNMVKPKIAHISRTNDLTSKYINAGTSVTQIKKNDIKFPTDRLTTREYLRNIENNDTESESSIVSNSSMTPYVENEKPKSKVSINNWACEYCTYFNKCGLEICEMCGKSRRKGNEDEPLISGGKECPKCTLINKKDVEVCDACNASLKDSPTYI